MSRSAAAHRNPFAKHWELDPEVCFLNHGSFGACPSEVLEAQTRLRSRIERQPVDFFVRQYGDLVDRARAELAGFLGAPIDGLVPVPNATTGVNAVLRSLRLSDADELLTTDQSYNACRNALDHVAAWSGATVKTVALPFPVAQPDQIVDAVLQGVTRRTRLVLIDHVTSPTGLVLPVEKIARSLSERGVDTLIDGAHAPGMLDLDVQRVGAAYYAGNCHKWICAPKGAGFLWVREDLRAEVRPVTISHGANQRRPGRSRYHDEFDWTGTADPTAFLSVPAAIRCVGSLLPGGWPELRARNRRLVLDARALLCESLEIPAPSPDSMVGSLAALPLPARSPADPLPPSVEDPLQLRLLEHHRIEVPIFDWPAPRQRIVRISAQLYNDIGDYERLAGALSKELRR